MVNKTPAPEGAERPQTVRGAGPVRQDPLLHENASVRTDGCPWTSEHCYHNIHPRCTDTGARVWPPPFAFSKYKRKCGEIVSMAKHDTWWVLASVTMKIPLWRELFKKHGGLRIQQVKNKPFKHPCNREEPNLTTCWSCFFYFNLCFRCVCSLKGYCLYRMACLREPCPSAWMLNQSAFVQGSIRTWPPVDGCKKEESNTSPPRGWPFQGTFAKLTAFLLYFLISSPSLFDKWNWHPNPNEMVFPRH